VNQLRHTWVLVVAAGGGTRLATRDGHLSDAIGNTAPFAL